MVLATDLIGIIQRETGLPAHKITNTVRLLDDGNTIPFIARYRKEATGELDEVQIRLIEEKMKYHRQLEQRKTEVIRLIDEQGKLTEKLENQILAATRPVDVEDLYRPYRAKRRTRASMARDKGLGPLADYLLSFPKEGDPLQEAAAYLSETVATPQEALQGAGDIVAEGVADDPNARGWVREHTRRQGSLAAAAKEAAADSVYRMYYNYSEPIKTIAPHRILAVNRGEREEILRVSVQITPEPILTWLEQKFVKQDSVTADLVKLAVADAYKRLIAPAVEREIRNELTEKAEVQAVKVFSRNLRSLLLQRPMRNCPVLAIDPAYRTGCKWAVMDATGRLLETGVFYPTPPQKRVDDAARDLHRLVEQYHLNTIVIGNGTASRETEQFVADFIKNKEQPGLGYTIVSEAGASVYSASPLAGREFPDLDVSARSAVSIGRRLQDPLAELVKIDPKSIGVGQYQHDVEPRRLEESLTSVVESAVNYVGVNLNTSSASLLTYVAGLNKTVADNIVRYREANGRFRSRRELQEVPRLGPKTLEQCVGFLRINDGDNPLDATGIHPESYELTKRLLDKLGTGLADIGTEAIRRKLTGVEVEILAQELAAGVPTVRDIVDNLSRPGRDPREDVPPPIFRTDVLKIEDLKPGMVLKGTVRNVVDFGAFVDIGVKQDGLVHISQLTNKFVRHPLDAVAVGDVVDVQVLSVNPERGQISLTMRIENV